MTPVIQPLSQDFLYGAYECGDSHCCRPWIPPFPVPSQQQEEQDHEPRQTDD